jgi:hypothetical protein
MRASIQPIIVYSVSQKRPLLGRPTNREGMVGKQGLFTGLALHQSKDKPK